MKLKFGRKILELVEGKKDSNGSVCPFCNSKDFYEEIISVDWGVGTQDFVVGGECKKCGQLSICNTCGVWSSDQYEIHSTWCKDFQEKIKQNAL